MDLSVIIVSFNTNDKLKMTLSSVFASKTNYSYEVWVVDNTSTDDSVTLVKNEFPQTYLIENQKNLGFSKANNQAIKKSRGRYVLLLNSDVEISPDTLEKVISFTDQDSKIGIMGCKVVKPDGSLDLASRRSFPNLAASFFRLSGLSLLFPNSKKFASYNLTFLSDDQVAEVDSVMGAFLLIKRAVIDQIGLLDEDFFMYGEDLDWCYRTKEAGFKVVYAPVTTVVHHKGSSSRRAPGKALYEFHRAMQLFYDKHYKNQYNWFMSFLVRVGIWSRYAFKVIINSFKKEKIVSK